MFSLQNLRVYTKDIIIIQIFIKSNARNKLKIKQKCWTSSPHTNADNLTTGVS